MFEICWFKPGAGLGTNTILSVLCVESLMISAKEEERMSHQGRKVVRGTTQEDQTLDVARQADERSEKAVCP
jgi:hypothetical protein